MGLCMVGVRGFEPPASASFPSFAAYGSCLENMFADPAYAVWSAKGVASGLSSWVRSNTAREVPLD